jgi:virginiamycin B lyase
VLRIDPVSNKIAGKVQVPGEVCSSLASGFGSIWTPVCGKKAGLLRIDAVKRSISVLPIAPAAPEDGIACSEEDRVWLVADKNGTLVRIDPCTNSVRQRISIPPGSYNPIFSDGIVWVTGVESGAVTAVDADTGKVLESIPVGAKPRFMTAGSGSIWILNQGDGTVTRVDEKSRRVLARIQVGIPGTGGDIGYGDVPLTRVEAATNRVVKQWIGKAGDSLRFGFDSLLDYGLQQRLAVTDCDPRRVDSVNRNHGASRAADGRRTRGGMLSDIFVCRIFMAGRGAAWNSELA